MTLENLTPEQREKALACKSPEEVLALAKQEGYELSDDELDQVSGGWGDVTYYVACPMCDWSGDITQEQYEAGYLICPACGHHMWLR